MLLAASDTIKDTLVTSDESNREGKFVAGYQYTLHTLHSFCVCLEAPQNMAIFRAGLMEMLTDESYEILTENNKVCLEAARGLVSKFGSPSMKHSVNG